MSDNDEIPTVPVVGMPCSFSCGSDRSPGHVSKVWPSGKTILVREAKVETGPGFDYYAQHPYIITPDPEGYERKFTLRKNGKWKSVGGTYRLGLGHASKYHDPHV